MQFRNLWNYVLHDESLQYNEFAMYQDRPRELRLD
jgi:hypothetical protein